jgi:glycerol-3-phosphate dehydrogenase
MKRNFADVSQKQWDLIIIGGGIVGTGIARDAALRGLSVLLVEKEDFAYGTTSHSTRLIHGGLRYLRMLEFKLVWQDLHEREALLRIAPHLVNKIEFAIPLLKSQPVYRMTLPFGLFLYDLLASGKSLPSHRHLSLTRTLQTEPALSAVTGLVGSYIYYDCQATHMERLCLENVLSAAAKGASLLNHTEAIDLLIEDNAVTGIRLKDRLSGQEFSARGRLVVNAGGPWADFIWNKLTTKRSFHLRRTKGIHLMTRKLTDHALVLFAKSDGRLFFVIPWNNCSLIGTTDTDFKDNPDTVGAETSDVDYLVKETRHYFPDFKSADVYFTMAGLRPLVASNEKDESNTSRAHRLIDHERQDGIKGLISIMGGKITAYRAIAEETVNVVCQKFQSQIPCITTQDVLPGGLNFNKINIPEIAKTWQIPIESIRYLAGLYGSRLNSVLEYIAKDKSLAAPIATGYPDIRAQIPHAVLEELALTINDFMLRRSLMGLSPQQGKDAVQVVAGQMATLLGWSEQETQTQIHEYMATLALTQKWRR